MECEPAGTFTFTLNLHTPSPLTLACKSNSETFSPVLSGGAFLEDVLPIGLEQGCRCTRTFPSYITKQGLLRRSACTYARSAFYTHPDETLSMVTHAK
eukprot:1158554-Pelagomonas_calceolata.AAC.13